MSFSTGISADGSPAQIPNEGATTHDYVRNKIKSGKKGTPLTRARIADLRLMKRAERKLNELLNDIPDDYLDQALRRLGEQLNATKKMWDVNAKCLINIPDERIRQDAAAMILAYKWGKPVERSITAHGDMDDFAAMLEKARQSPAALEALQNTVLAHETVPTLEESQIGEHQ